MLLDFEADSPTRSVRAVSNRVLIRRCGGTTRSVLHLALRVATLYRSVAQSLLHRRTSRHRYATLATFRRPGCTAIQPTLPCAGVRRSATHPCFAKDQPRHPWRGVRCMQLTPVPAFVVSDSPLASLQAGHYGPPRSRCPCFTGGPATGPYRVVRRMRLTNVPAFVAMRLTLWRFSQRSGVGGVYGAVAVAWGFW